jgi:hypothetical protein
MRRANNVATTVARPHASRLLHVWIRERRCLRTPFQKSLHQLRARITDAIAQVGVDV